jgi:hypothetical protein
MSTFFNLAYFLLLATTQTANLFWVFRHLLPIMLLVSQDILPGNFGYFMALAFFTWTQYSFMAILLVLVRQHFEEIHRLYD